MFLGRLVQDLAQLREAAVLRLQSLQAEQHKLENEIRKAQERHQTVRLGPSRSCPRPAAVDCGGALSPLALVAFSGQEETSPASQSQSS